MDIHTHHYSFLAVSYTLTEQKTPPTKLAFFQFSLCCQSTFPLKVFFVLQIKTTQSSLDELF